MAVLPKHRFEELASTLRGEIQTGVISPGSLLPTERELQARYHVSRTTVRRALQVLTESGWAENLPNRGVLARLGPIAGSSRRIAFVDHRDLVHKSLFFRLHTLLEAKGYSLVHVDSQDVGTQNAIQQASDQGFAAAFVWPKLGFIRPDELVRLQNRIPVVFVDHTMGSQACEVVMSDHCEGARRAITHLLDLGRRRVAITGNFTHHEDSQMRFTGYVAAHADRGGFPGAADYVFSSPGGLTYEDTRLLRYRLSEEDRPDAVFVLHDMSVPAVVETIYDMGLRVPSDVAVVGFGNDLPFTIDGVGLTTTAMNWDRVAEVLVERMEFRLHHPHAPFRRTLVPTRLIVRGSCGAPRAMFMNEPYEVSSVTITGRMPPRTSDPTPISLTAHSSVIGEEGMDLS